jgi:hypothetical protein
VRDTSMVQTSKLRDTLYDWRSKMNFSLRPEVTRKSSVLDKVLYLNGGHGRLFPTFIRPSQRYGGRERPRFCYLRLRWEFSIVPPFIQYLNFFSTICYWMEGLSTCNSMSAVPFTESLFVLLGVKTVLSVSSFTGGHCTANNFRFMYSQERLSQASLPNIY